jgi:ESS family glutamate:Na+ symporter
MNDGIGTIEIGATRVLLSSIGVLWLGGFLTGRVALLRRFHIPIAVTGGLALSIALALLEIGSGVRVSFDLDMRDTLLLVFFSTIGLSAKLQLLREGGRLLAILGGATFVFLVMQNAVGLLTAGALDLPLVNGLLGGSISLAGGHGTAITWGEMAAEAGFPGAQALGLAFATLGLVAGGLIGGPIAEHLIRRHRLEFEGTDRAAAGDGVSAAEPELEVSVTSRKVLRSLLLLAICFSSGAELNRWLGQSGVVVPGFLTAMAVGIVLTNFADLAKREVDEETLSLFGEVSLHLFLAMSLMSMPLTQLAGELGAVLVILLAQMVAIAAFVTTVIFRIAGRDYDAAIIASGFAGLGLGATPVGIANMNAVTSRFGPSPKAFLVVPLIGAFLLDILNAAVIQGYVTFLR